MLRVSRRLLDDSGDAEDLAQETLFLAWRNFHQFRQDTNVRAWLFRILFNLFYSQKRKQRAGLAVVGVESVETFSANLTSSLIESMDISRSLNALPLEHRTVLVLGIVEGFTCREMSEILSLPIGTVMSRLSRARQALRAQVESGAKYSTKEAS